MASSNDDHGQKRREDEWPWSKMRWYWEQHLTFQRIAFAISLERGYPDRWEEFMDEAKEVYRQGRKAEYLDPPSDDPVSEP